MKKFIAGTLFGAILVLSTSVFADGALEQVTAYLRPDLPVTLDGKPLELKKPPIMYDGSTYLQLRDAATALGKDVQWNDQKQTVELRSQSSEPTVKNDSQKTSDGIKTVSIDGAFYVEIHDIILKYYDAGYNLTYNSDTKTTSLTYNGEKGHPVDKTKVISPELAITVADGASYISYNDYEKILLPLIKAN